MLVLALIVLFFSVTPVRAESAAGDGYGRLDLSFEANLGQTDPAVKFMARGNGYGLFLTRDEAVLRFVRPADAVVRMKFHGAARNPQLEGLDPLPGKVHYLTGKQHRTDIPSYKQVRYNDIYPGIDVVYYGSQRLLEYDFMIGPSADPSKIGLIFDGVDGISIGQNGDLILKTGAEELQQKKPVAYQVIDGKKREVEVAYVIAEGRVGFQIGAYDRSKQLVIDPVLAYSSYLGGSATGNIGDQGNAIAVDAQGNAYVAGFTASADFPVANALDGAHGGAQDAFVLKVNPTGTALLFSTFIGGAAADEAHAIGLDSGNNIIIAGFTASSDFPLVNAVQPTRGGNQDVFITKLNNNGNTILYSTYLGGAEDERALALAIDVSGSAYITGLTSSPAYPVAGAVQPAFAGGQADVFVTKINSEGGIVYSTFVGGFGHEQGYTIGLDSAGSAYVAGYTTSTNFPLVNTPATGFAGGTDDAFLFKLSPSGGSLAYSTFFGGTGTDNAVRLVVDSEGGVVVTGLTSSLDFPVANALNPLLLSTFDAFIIKFNPDGRDLAFSTYMGGLGTESGAALAQDAEGNLYVGGFTDSFEMPIVNAIQQFNAGGRDAYVMKLSADGQTVIYSTYIGGAGNEGAVGIAVDSVGNAYVTGFTTSTDFPASTGAVQSANAGGADGFVFKIYSQDIVTSAAFTVPAEGMRSFTTGGTSRQSDFGYATAQAGSAETRPAGLLIVQSTQNDAIVHEVGLPAPALITAGRMYVEVNGNERSVISIANPHDEDITVDFYYTNLTGESSKFTTATVAANSHFSRFVNDDPILIANGDLGTLTFESSQPVAASGFHTITNERSEFIISALPVQDLNKVFSEQFIIPHFAQGQGWSTEVVLVNPTDETIRGEIRFMSPGANGQPGQPLDVFLTGSTTPEDASHVYGYEIAPRSIQIFETISVPFETGEGQEEPFRTGWIHVVPSAGRTPAGTAMLSRFEAAIRVTRTAIDPQLPARNIRLYAEGQGNFNDADVNSIQTGIAIANLSLLPAIVRIELTAPDGTPKGQADVTVPARGQLSRFLKDIPGFETLAVPFQGVLKLTTTSPEGVAATAVRARFNERRNFIVATTGPIVENSGIGSEIIFPHIAEGGGYTTQFILLNGTPGQPSTGTLRFLNTSGLPINLTLQP